MGFFRVENICKYFSGLKAVDNVTFAINEGEIVSVIGPNGAGKTTLFNVISGHYLPTRGRMIFLNKDITALSPNKIVYEGISRTFQNIRLFSNLTVIENVMIGLHTKLKSGIIDSLLQLSKTKQEEIWCYNKGLEFLAKVGLEDKRAELAKNLSYGEQRRLEIVRALACEPKLLMLDEPTAGMNIQEAMEIMHFIKELRNDGITIILIEHNMRVVMGISDRIIVLNHGVKIAEGKPKEIQSNSDVIEAYLGRRDKNAAS
jgi:branched-chain amino acid transport system ATP-binding protein